MFHAHSAPLGVELGGGARDQSLVLDFVFPACVVVVLLDK